MIAELTERPAARRIAIASVAVLLFAGIVAIATNSGDSGGVGDARLTTKGTAAVTNVNGQRRNVSGTVALHRGETVEAVDGELTIELPDGSTVKGRTSYKGSDPTRVKIAQPVELLAGDLLVTSNSGADVDSGGNRVHLDSSDDAVAAARVSRTLAVGAAVFRGSATFDSAGQTRTIPALRTLEVSSLGRPPASPSVLIDDPRKPDTIDPWDRQFLGEAIDLGGTLDTYADTYSQTLGPTNGVTIGGYKEALPSLTDEAEFTPALLAASPHKSGEFFVGAALASLSRSGSFGARWQQIFALYDAGMNWGFIALDQGVAADPLLSTIQDGLNKTRFPFAEAARTPATTGTTATTTGTSPTTTGATTPTSAPTTTPPTTPPPTTTLVPVPPTGSPLVDGIVKDVNSLLGGLLGGRPPGG